MIDVMTRLKIHHMAVGDIPQARIAERCGIGLRSVECILSEPSPTPAEVAAGGLSSSSRRRGRPPKVDSAVVERIRLLLESEPKLPSIEVLRRSREWGCTSGRSQMAALVRKLRPKPKEEPVVRFEGLPGEYAQFDFGECEVNLLSTGR